MNRAILRQLVLLAILTMICTAVIARGPHLFDPVQPVPELAAPDMTLPEITS